jgi:hypothetical protein
MKTSQLSKSRFLLGLQCPKWLYLAAHHPELIPPPDPALQALFDQGDQVGLLATKLYPGGRMIEWGRHGYKGVVEETKELLDDISVPAIFEAAFEVDGLRIKADILTRLSNGGWNLLEVKQGTRVKDVNLWDVAFQKHVLTMTGLEINNSFLVHLNRDYVYPGGEPDLEQLFYRVNLSAEIHDLVDKMPSRIDELNSILAGKAVPDIDIGPHCTDPYDCPLWEHCTFDKPEHWVQYFYRLSQTKKAELESRGIHDIRHVPEDFPLSLIQDRIRNVLIRGKPYFDPEVKRILQGLHKPIHYLDFETFMPAIPIYPGTSPYDTIPFQWSLHVQDEGGNLKHHAFLADDKDDPRSQLVSALLDAVASQGDVLIYTNYEIQILRSLIPLVPEKASEIEVLIERCVDLCAIVRNNVYHPDFHQSFSLKCVLPALVPDMAYDDLEIQDGETASLSFHAMLEERDLASRAKLRKALLDYCERDTLGMVQLKNVLLAL